MSNNELYGRIKAKDLKEFLKGVDDDYVVEVLEDYYINPTSSIKIDKESKKILISQGI